MEILDLKINVQYVVRHVNSSFITNPVIEMLVNVYVQLKIFETQSRFGKNINLT